MKTYEAVSAIIDTMPEDEFQKLCKDDFDQWDSDRRIARNGKARLLRRLAKYGLTLADWEVWENE